MKSLVRPITVDDLPTALSILNGSLGESYVTASELEQCTESTSRIAYVADNADGNPTGVMTGDLLLPGADLGSIVHPSLSKELGILVPESRFSRLGILKSGAVVHEARGAGIGTELAGKVTDHLFREGATCIIALAWVDGDGCHAEVMMKRLGYQIRGDIAELWKQDSIDQEYDCPSCGNPCRCSGRVFVQFRHRWAYSAAS